jgi:hypothetical protein
MQMDGLSRRGHVNWINVDGDVVAVDGVTGEVHLLRGSVAVVWQLLDGAPLDGLDKLVAEAFSITRGDASAGIDASLAMLQRAGIVEDVNVDEAIRAAAATG